MSQRPILGVVGLTSLVLLCGCFKAKTVVTVEKDGSGTVEQTVHTKAMDLPFPGVEKPSPEEELAKAREQAEQNAQKMGEGVTVQTVERAAPRDGWPGVRTVYAFQDVTKLGVVPMPDADIGGVQMGGPGMGEGPPGGPGMGEGPPGGPEMAASAEEDDEEPVRFEFTAGPTPKLTILTPPMGPPAEAGGPDEAQDAQEQAMAMMMGQFMDGMVVEFHVKVGGTITETDATYLSPSRKAVGLMRLDFGALAKNPSALGKLMALDENATPEEMEKQLQDPQLKEHVKMETKERVEITFE